MKQTTLLLPFLIAAIAAPTLADAAVCSDPGMIAERIDRVVERLIDAARRP